MFSLIYLISAFAGGFAVAQKIKIVDAKENMIWSKIAMSIGIGYILSGWITYIISYFAKVILNLKNPKIYGNVVAILVMSIIVIWSLEKSPGRRYTSGMVSSTYNINLITDMHRFMNESICFGILFIFILASMFYVFYVDGSVLKSGVTVFSDYAPHTAMIRSFSYHDNFPTQYPHYGGADIKYHFMFQFFVGNLEYLGMRIDCAFNLTSAAALWSFLILLYFFAKSITQSSIASYLTIFMFFCRSSFAIFGQILNSLVTDVDFWKNTKFIGWTAHEDWGLWNYNVFLNQRHLGFGFLIGIIPIMYFAERLNWLDTESERVLCKRIPKMFLGPEVWTIYDWKTSLYMGMLLGALAFWNGAVVIAILLILFGFAVFSKYKFDYLITAVTTIILSFLQALFFTDEGFGVKFQFGFLSSDKSFWGILSYIFMLSGIFFFGLIVIFCILRGKKRAMLISFLLPLFFAFSISMTPDITVNHKYIMLSVVFLNIIWAYCLIRLFNIKNIYFKTISILLIFLLTATGVYDLLTIHNANKSTISINMDSNLTSWLKSNTTEDDIILTGQDSMSEVTLSGAMLYSGWPYYAWSAGYDTDDRAETAIKIYTSSNQQEVAYLVESEQINYILYEKGMKYDNYNCSDETIKKLYDCVYSNMDYKIYAVN